MKLFHMPRTRSDRARWMLEEIGVPHELVTVDVFAGQGRSPEHLTRHPLGHVPVLEIGGVTLIESAAICMHLADLHPEAKLAPPLATPERAKYYEWMTFVPASVDPCLETIMFHTVFLPEDKRLPKLVESQRRKWQKIEQYLVKRLDGQRFAVGDAFTAADILIASCLLWARMAGALSDSPVLAAYLAEHCARPAFARVYS